MLELMSHRTDFTLYDGTVKCLIETHTKLLNGHRSIKPTVCCAPTVLPFKIQYYIQKMDQFIVKYIVKEAEILISLPIKSIKRPEGIHNMYSQ